MLIKFLRKVVAATMALALVLAIQSPVHAQRTIEQAADALLGEILTNLNIEITNEELLLELSFELQYALDTGIVDSETIDDLDIEILDEELPDEELFEEDEETQLDDSSDTTAPDSTTSQLSEELKLRIRNRLTLRLTAQVKYWEVIAEDWNTASQMAARKFTTCLDAATSDEESDICYFNEQQQLQFFYAQQLGDNFAARLSVANQLGSDVVALLNQSMTRSRLTVQEALQFMNAEELGTLGLTPQALDDISQKLESQQDSRTPSSEPSNKSPANSTPSSGAPSSIAPSNGNPTNSNPPNGQNQ